MKATVLKKWYVRLCDLNYGFGFTDHKFMQGPVRWENGKRYCQLCSKMWTQIPVVTTVAGHAEVMAEAERMQGTPVTGPWSLNGGRD